MLLGITRVCNFWCYSHLCITGIFWRVPILLFSLSNYGPYSILNYAGTFVLQPLLSFFNISMYWIPQLGSLFTSLKVQNLSNCNLIWAGCGEKVVIFLSPNSRCPLLKLLNIKLSKICSWMCFHSFVESVLQVFNNEE